MKVFSLGILIAVSIFSICVFGFFSVQPAVKSETFVVDTDLDYSSIQAAIDNAQAGDIIQVSQGTYDEIIVVNKSLHLLADFNGSTILNAKGNDILTIAASNVTIQGFIFSNASSGIILNHAFFCTIYDNTFMDLHTGISVNNNSADNLFYENNFIDNNNNAIDPFSNTWNTSVIGNFWDDYNGNDTNNDSIIDQPYSISNGANHDFLPSIKPFSSNPFVDFSFSPTTPFTTDVVQFTSLSNDTDGYITSWFWDFGDNITSDQKNPTHQFMKAGTYMVSLKITDMVGSTNKTSKNITVLNVPPVASFSFSPMNPTDIEQVFFEDTSSDIDGSIVNWTWDFGDNVTSFDQNPRYTFPDNGSFGVSLTVKDDNNDTGSVVHVISVSNVAPIADFTFSFSNVTALIDQPVYFQDTSIDPDGGIVSREWYFGDNSNSSERNPSHTYSQKGSYSVSLTIVDNDGEVVSKTKQITVSDTIKRNEVITEFSLFDIVFVVFLVVMIVLVIVLSKKYG